MTPAAGAGELALFQRFPRLRDGLARLPLGSFPSPVQRLEATGRELGLERLYLKRDDLCGADYGSNKVRKLEFLLGQALRQGAREVLTLGFAGSNHSLATALCAHKAGLGCVSVLMPQVPTRYARTNLLASLACSARLRPCSGPLTLGPVLAWQWLRAWLRSGARPGFIPAGGSSALGAVAYVNAALELQAQVAAGELPRPDRIYLPFGSMGSAAGLALGLRAAGWTCPVHAVRVIEPLWASQAGFRRLLRRTAALLHRLDPDFPAGVPEPPAWTIRDGFLGPGYARFTPAGQEAAQLLRRTARIPANGTYSAKAFAALVADARAGALAGETVLYWNTFNSRDLAPLTAGMDFRDLPAGLRRCFTDELQALDLKPGP